MSIPDYTAIKLPLLELLADEAHHSMSDVTQQLADKFNLTDAERDQMLPSGQQSIIANRVGWAKTYLKKAGLLENPSRGRVRITAEGLRVLQQKPRIIDNDFLRQYPSFSEFIGTSRAASPDTSAIEAATTAKTPEESIEQAYADLRAALVDDILERVKGCSPRFFEQLVVRLLVAMGYGGTLADAGQAVGKSGDGGIDGIIKEDMLGLDVLCVQAKRWTSPVGRPVIQAFAGSMEGFRARKGVLITTSSFSKDAYEYINRVERKIVLIDGQQLANLMVDHNLGITISRTFVLKRADSDFFSDEEQ